MNIEHHVQNTFLSISNLFFFFLIFNRFEQSIAEATKITKIREELDKLDQELAADVEILRKEIEAVTLQYTNTK